jgi:hypothetical protein
LMRAERRGAISASAVEAADLGLATMIIDDESWRKERVRVCCSCERVVDQRTRDNVDRGWFRSPPEFPASPP